MKLVLFIPFFKFWNQALLTGALLKNLKPDDEVTLITCNEDLIDSCMVFSTYKDTFNTNIQKKRKICSECTKNKKVFIKNFKNKKVFDLSDFLEKKDLDEIELILKSVNKKNYKELKIDNINVGEIAIHDIILIQRLNSVEQVTSKFWFNYLDNLRTCLKIIFASKRIFYNQKFDISITFNNLYSSNRIFAKYSEKKNIKNYCLHNGYFIPEFSLQFLKLTEGITGGTNYHVLNSWKIKKNFIIKDFEYDLIEKHYDSVFLKANHYFNYSKPINSQSTKKYLNKKVKNYNTFKKCIFVPLSGSDEDVCLIESGVSLTYSPQYKKIYNSQNQWIKSLIKFAKKNKDFIFIIRPHPRDWPSNKINILSDNYKTYNSIFANLPQNIIINTPDENISAYDFLEICDLVLAYGSTIAIEYAILGYPVIISDLPIYRHVIPKEYQFETEQSYFNIVKKNLDKEFQINLKHSEMFCRWFILSNYRDTLDISEIFKKNELQNLQNTFKKILDKISEKYMNNYFKNKELKDIKFDENISKKLNYFFENNCNSFVDLEDLNFSKQEIKKLNMSKVKKMLNKFALKYNLGRLKC